MRALLRFLSSLWLGITLIALMALACIYGSIVFSDPDKGGDYALEHVFHTEWFLGLMGLLMVNLVLCSWEKSYIALTLYKKRNLVSRPAFFEKAGHVAVYAWTGSLDTLESLLRRRYTVVAREGHALYAQKGLLGRCGATIIHIGLIWTFAAGYYRILADDYGWGIFDSTVIIPEGETSNTYFSRIDRLKKATEDNLKERPLPFQLHALDFRAEYYPHSTVARYFSSLIELKDGDHSQINEVTMAHPMIYKGYKVTQNSFSENERVVRGKFRITDVANGNVSELDAGPGDPVRLKLSGTGDLFFQVDALEDGTTFTVLDLAKQKIIVTGNATSVTPAPPSIDVSGFQEEIGKSKYSFLVAALFPNFRFDENKQPTTVDEKFDNPAALVMLFKNGKPNGYAWLFLNKEARDIMGQPHPEMNMEFAEYRKAPDAKGSNGLYDYQVQIKFKQKDPAKDLGAFWASPGQVMELAGVDQKLLDAPNVVMGETPHVESDDKGPTTSPMGEKRGGAAPPMPAGGEKGPYRVEYLGHVTGHVTYLGFMRDPSVGWLFTGVIIVILGTIVAFVINYRETWVWYDEENGRLCMATQVRGTSPAAHREFDRIALEAVALNSADNPS